MKILLIIGILCVQLIGINQNIWAQSAITIANNVLKNRNVVRVYRNGDRKGYGFLVGENGGNAIIVTAKHILLDNTGTQLGPPLSIQEVTVEITLLGSSDRIAAEVLPFPRDGIMDTYDMAFLKIQTPNINWQDKIESLTPGIGTDIIVLGTEEGARELLTGTIASKTEGGFRINNPAVVRGSSGAPIVDCRGIIGMVTADNGPLVIATSLQKIKEIASLYDYLNDSYTLKAGYVPFNEVQKTFIDYVPVAGQYKRGQSVSGIIYTAGTIGGVIMGVIAQNEVTTNLNKSNTALNVSDQLRYQENADNWKTIQKVSFIVAGVTACIAFFDGIFAKGIKKDICLFPAHPIEFDLAYQGMMGVRLTYRF